MHIPSRTSSQKPPNLFDCPYIFLGQTPSYSSQQAIGHASSPAPPQSCHNLPFPEAGAEFFCVYGSDVSESSEQPPPNQEAAFKDNVELVQYNIDDPKL